MDLELSGRGGQQQGPPSSSQQLEPQRPSPPAFYAAAPPPPLPQNRLPVTFVPPPLSGQATPLLPPPPTYASSLPQQQQQQQHYSALQAPASLDDLADAFLAAGDAQSDGEADGPSASSNVRLRPEPLDTSPVGGTGGDVDRLKSIASRRAWADVVATAQQLIKPGSTSLYATLYGDLLLHHSKPNQSSSLSPSSSSSTPPPSAVLALESQQEELGDILVLLVKGLLYMRRYLELKQQLDQWGFLFHNLARSRAASPTAIMPAPSWIPWKLHILAATALLDIPPSMSPPATGVASVSASSAAVIPAVDALDVLWTIRDAIPSTDMRNTILAEQALSNALVRTKRWRMAVGCLQRVMDLLPAAVQEYSTDPQSRHSMSPDDAQVLEASYRVELLSCQGRILLQLGALSEAEQVFQEARASWDESSTVRTHATESASFEVVRRAPIQLAANHALLCFASNHFEQALELFRHVATLIRQDSKSYPKQPRSTYDRNAGIDRSGIGALMGVPPLSSLYSETCNNMAICAIYTCRLHEAIHLMESLVRQDPTSYLTDRVALNLCTLYELSSDTAVASRKKRVLQVVAKRFFLHDIGSECFRLG